MKTIYRVDEYAGADGRSIYRTVLFESQADAAAFKAASRSRGGAEPLLVLEAGEPLTAFDEESYRTSGRAKLTVTERVALGLDPPEALNVELFEPPLREE